MRVLVLADHLGHSNGKVHGGTTYFLNHLPAMARRFDLTVCFVSRSHPAAEQLREDGVDPLFLDRGRLDPTAAKDVLKLIRERRIDLLHMHSQKSHIIGGLLAIKLGIPCLLHIHDAIASPRGLRTLNKWISRRIAGAITVSDELRWHAQNEYGFAPENITTLFHSLDLTPFHETKEEEGAALREELGISKDTRLIVLVGRVNPDKGQLEMIQAMNTVIAAKPQAKLLIVGEGPSLELCRQQAKSLKLEDRVIIAGQRSDIPQIMKAADLVAMPSIWVEAFGYAALEAIASGRAVVAFRSGGIPSIVQDGKTGLLVDHRDFPALAQAIIGLIDDKDRLRRMGDAGREHAKTFNLERHLNGLANIYERASHATSQSKSR